MENGVENFFFQKGQKTVLGRVFFRWKGRDTANIICYEWPDPLAEHIFVVLY